MFRMKKAIQKIYLSFNLFLMKMTRICWKHSKLTLFIFSLITLFLASNLSRMKIVFSAEDLAGQGFPSADEIKVIKEKYQDGVTSLFIFSPPEGQFSFSTEELCQIRKWYSFKRNAIPELISSVSTFDFKLPKRDIALDNNRLRVRNILDLDCENKKLLVAPQEIRKALNDSPFALVQEKKEKLSLLFQFTFKDSTTSKFGSFDPKIFDSLRASVYKDLQPISPKSKISWIGPGDYQWYILEGFKFSKYINMGMILFMLLGLRFIFGTWRSGILFCGTLTVSAIWVFGLKGLMGSSFDVLSTGLILILGISSLEDFTFTSYDQFKSQNWKKSILKMVIPSFYTSLTTMLGFLSLCISDVEAVRRMGLWAAWGALIEWVIVFLFMPSFLQQFKKFKTWNNSKKAWKFKFLSSSIFKPLPKSFSKISLIIYPLSVMAFFHLNYNEAPHRIFPPKQEYSRSINELERSRGWVGNSSLIFDKDLEEDDMKNIVDAILKNKFANDIIANHESPWEIKSWLAKKGNLDKIESDTYFSLSKLHDQFVAKDERVRVLFYLKDTSVEPVEKLKQIVAQNCDGRCHLGGEVLAYSDFAGLVPKTLVDSLVTSLILVSIIICFIAIAQNKERLIPSLLLSSFWGPFFIIMVLGMMHSTLDFWKSIFASILVGLTGDNAIQYLFGSEKKDITEGIEDRGMASILTATLMALTSLVYLGSYFSSPKVFGIILCVGLLASLFGDLWLFQGFLSLSKSSKN